MPLDKSAVRVGGFRSILLSMFSDVDRTVLRPAVYRSLSRGNFKLSNSPRLLQEEGWSVMKRPDFPFSDVYPADFDKFPGNVTRKIR